MNVTPETIHSDILARLASVRRKRNMLNALAGLWLSLSLFGIALLSALVLEEIFYLSVPARTLSVWLLAGGLVILISLRVALPIARLIGVLPDEPDYATAERVGYAFPELKDRLVNILQLYRERGDSSLYSATLIDAAILDLGKQTGGLEFTRAISAASARRMRRVFSAVAVLAFLTLAVSPSNFLGSAYRLWHFGEAFAAPSPFALLVEPGNKEVIKGTDVTIRVRAEGASPQNITLTTLREGEIVTEETVLKHDADGLFRHELKSVKRSTIYGVSAGSVRSEKFTLTVMDRPVMTRLNITVTPPSYTGLPAQHLDDNVGDVTALVGSRVGFAVEANKELGDAAVIFSDSTALLLQTHGSRAVGSHVLRRSCTYHIRLMDLQGTRNADPVDYTLRSVSDAYPVVSILVPGRNIDVADNTALALLIKISDDFGFSSLRLFYRLVQSKYEQPSDHFSVVDVPIPRTAGNEATISYAWSLSPMHLVPEDVVSYHVEVFDNDRISGPKSAVSESYTLRLPSLEEVFQNIEQGHEAGVEEMKKALTGAEEVHKELEELKQELRREQQKLDWQSQKKVEDLVKKYDEIRNTMDNVNKTVDQMLEQMQQNQVLSKETLDKYQELQQLMQELNAPELAEAMKKLQQAMQQLNPEALKQALQQLSFSEETFRKSLERTINLIKRLQIEQKIDELVKRAEAAQKTQEDLQQKTERARPEDQRGLNDLQLRQKGTREQVERLQRELDQLQKRMEEFPREMPLAEMQNLQDSIHASGIDKQMQEIDRNLAQQNLDAAAQHQQKASQKMGRMAQQLRQLKSAMQQNQQQQIVSEMRRALDDLLELSRREEGLKNESQGLEPNSQRFRDNAQAQMDVMRDLGNTAEKMSGLSQKTFGVTPEMGKSIGDAMRQMSSAMQSLEQRNAPAASQQQGSAMGALNEAAQLMENAMSAMMQSGGEGMMGMSGFLQRLQQLGESQQGINEGTRNLGGLSAQQAAEMARLAGEQGIVRKSLEQLQREAAATGELSKMLGDLRSIAQEMREVQTDLAQGNVNPETQRRQERILSRLLESQRSLRERDYENRRRAESGKSRQRSTPQGIDLTSQDGQNRLRKDLLKALQEGYARDYEELIRKYFEALEQHGEGEDH